MGHILSARCWDTGVSKAYTVSALMIDLPVGALQDRQLIVLNS